MKRLQLGYSVPLLHKIAPQCKFKTKSTIPIVQILDIDGLINNSMNALVSSGWIRNWICGGLALIEFEFSIETS